MNDNKSRDIFYGVVAVATLIVALIGATLAYFSMNASSNEGAVNAKAAVVSIDYKDGQEVLMQSENLIPTALDKVQTIYMRNLATINSQYGNAEGDRTRLCKDGYDENYDVCSIYRFSIKNEGSAINVKGVLRTEDNQFTDLAYAVRLVEGDATGLTVDSNNWLTLTTVDDQPQQYIELKTCTGEECFTTDENSIKTYTTNASNPLFGFAAANGTAFKTIDISNERVFDVVLFILEKDKPQDYDQGKTFNGTIYVETPENAVHITGRTE